MLVGHDDIAQGNLAISKLSSSVLSKGSFDLFRVELGTVRVEVEEGVYSSINYRHVSCFMLDTASILLKFQTRCSTTDLTVTVGKACLPADEDLLIGLLPQSSLLYSRLPKAAMYGR